MRILQYVFCILSVLCAASAVIVGIFTKSVLGAAIVAAGCIFFAVLMLLVKKKLEPPAPKKRGRPAGSANKKQLLRAAARRRIYLPKFSCYRGGPFRHFSA